tara:strand:- start:3673 stop:4008 length:336 start_codon:yes stop_codon:yes gene_type:complete
MPLLSEGRQTSTQPLHEPELISLDECVLIAHDEIATLTEEAKEALVKAVTEAVANERRELLPIIAGLEEEAAQWKAEATPSFWDEHGLAVAGVSLVVGSILTSVLFSVIPE